jgi:putative DNA primase/helicase
VSIATNGHPAASPAKRPRPALVDPKRYRYLDAYGHTLYVATARVEAESGIDYEKFTAPDKIGGSLAGVQLVPYNLGAIIGSSADAPVFVCGDEEEVDALSSKGIAATCAPRVTRWFPGEWEVFCQGKTLAVISRFDDFDRQRCEEIAGLMARTAATVKVIQPGGLRSKMSLAQWAETFADGDPASVLIAEFENALPVRQTSLAGQAIARICDPELEALSDDDLGITPALAVQPRSIQWAWKHRLSRAGLTLIAGDGGIGKSQVLLYIASIVSTGGEWPDGQGRADVGNVIIVSAEDRPEDTIMPRLMAMGADISRITLLKPNRVVRKEGKPPQVHPQSFQDIHYWLEVVRRVRPSMLIVDPLPSYLGRGVNDSKNIEIRAVLEPFLEQVIERFLICMLGNTHLNKSADSNTPVHRITGSIAYVNLPRNVHVVVRDPDDPHRKFIKSAKANLSPEDLPALAFKIEARTVVGPNGEEIEASMPVFEAETVSIDLAAVMGGKKSKRGPDPKKTMAAAEWLYDFLAGRPGPTPLGAIFDAAGESGMLGQKTAGRWSNPNSLYRAKDAIGQLPAPKDGGAIEEFDIPRNDGRPRKEWHLVTPDRPF